MDTFLASSFGTFVMTVWHGVLSAPSWHNFTYLAYGWAIASGRQTITTYLWGSGAAQVKHFSRYYAFLGRALYQHRYQLWARVIRCGAALVPADAVIEIRLDDATMKKTGRHIQGAAHYRNGAGTARQEYRTLWGITLVWAIMRLPFGAGQVTTSACPLASSALAKNHWPTHSKCPIARAAPSPVASSSMLPRHSQRAPSAWRPMAALPLRPSDAISPATAMWWGVSSSPPHSINCRPRVSKVSGEHRAKKAR